MPHITITLTVTLRDPMPDFNAEDMAQEMQGVLGTIVPFNQVAPE